MLASQTYPPLVSGGPGCVDSRGCVQGGHMCVRRVCVYTHTHTLCLKVHTSDRVDDPPPPGGHTHCHPLSAVPLPERRACGLRWATQGTLADPSPCPGPWTWTARPAPASSSPCRAELKVGERGGGGGVFYRPCSRSQVRCVLWCFARLLPTISCPSRLDSLALARPC